MIRPILTAFVLFICLMIPILSFGQNDFSPRSPIGHPLIYSGSFGELRSGHFHAGADIKAAKWNVVGDPIYAVADGFVSRINVRGVGYGKAIYIDHPEGYTSVYGHLNRYRKDIAEYVEQQQYKLQSFSVNLFPDSTAFVLKKGDIIGYMGNTGRSSAPHLHFELRHTASEKPVNPYWFDIGPADTRPPTLLNLNIVNLSPDTAILDRERYTLIHKGNGRYGLATDTLAISAWRVGIEINGFDRMDGASNKNGIYDMKMLVNDQLAYHYTMDSFSFDEFKHINAHINYPDYDELKRRYQRLYILPGDPLSIYQPVDTSLSIFPLFKNDKQKVKIIASDFKGNASVLEFWVKRDPAMHTPPPIHYNYKLEVGKTHLIREEDYILFVPDSALYQLAYLHIQASDSIEAPLASRQLFINANNIFKYPVDIFIKPLNVPDTLLDKLCIVSCGEKNLTSYGGDIFEGYITTKIKKYGDYGVFLDTVPPEIKPVIFSENLNYDKIQFTISDNLETAGRTKSIRYDGYIDDQWVLFEYDAKTSSITHYFRKSLSSGEHTLRIELLDDRNNKTILKRNFIKQ